MASATNTTERRTKTVEETVPVVQLVLDTEEAASLVQVLRSLGGDRYNGGRVHTDKVLTALQSKAGVVPSSYPLQGTLYFGKTSPFLSETVNGYTTMSVR